jgi:non-ribosomal peptide synthetase component F
MMKRLYQRKSVVLKDAYAYLIDGDRMRPTGDMVRVEWQGSEMRIEYVGRKDSQVKRLGKRIQLEQIAQCLESCQGVRRCW